MSHPSPPSQPSSGTSTAMTTPKSTQEVLAYLSTIPITNVIEIFWDDSGAHKDSYDDSDDEDYDDMESSYEEDGDVH